MTEVAVEAVNRQAMSSRVDELAAQIAGDYEGRLPVLVGILNGALPLLADLARRLETHIEVDFLALTKFAHGGQVRLSADTATPLTGRHVLLVEDLVDTGLTLAAIQRLLEPRLCASVRTLALFDKAPRRIAEVTLDYRGFEVGDEFLVGYGLDYHGWFRNLPSVWAVLDFSALAEDPGAFAAAAFGWPGDNLRP